MSLDYGDLKFFGEPASSFESLNPSQLSGRQSAASRYLKSKNKKNLTGLQASTGLNRRILLGGDPYILAVRDGKVIPIPYSKYMDALTNSFRIPQRLLADIKSKEGITGLPGKVFQPGTADNFQRWYREFIAGQKGEQSFFRKLGKAFEEANLEDAAIPGKKSTDVDLSHLFPKKEAGIYCNDLIFRIYLNSREEKFHIPVIISRHGASTWWSGA